ncbi:MAG TPA: hypothetical protein VIZ68_05535 [Thermoplasmata archaeon]
MTYHALRVCANRGAFEAVPSQPVQLDLAKVRSGFELEGIPVLDCRVMLIAQMEREVTVGRDGRILIKSTDGEEAQRVLKRVEAVLATASAA